MSTVLIIDDDTFVLKEVRQILELENFRVIMAEDGLRGIALARTRQPQLVICDVVMPVLDGFMVLKQLRAFPETKHIPLIFITGFRNNPIVRRILDEGQSDCLFKPFTIDQLLSRIGDSLSARQG